MDKKSFVDALVKRGFRGRRGVISGEIVRPIAEALYDRLTKTAADYDDDDLLDEPDEPVPGLDMPELNMDLDDDLMPDMPIEEPAGAPASLHERQLELWRQWQKTGNDQYVEDLLDSLTPLFKHVLNKYTQYPIPYNILMHKSMMLARDALGKYDPTKSKLSTYVMNQIRPLDRFVKQYQNVSYVPEFLSKEFGRYEAAQQALADNLGRTPNDAEMAEYMKMPLNHIQRIRAAKTQSMLASSNVSEREEQFIDNARSKLDDRAIYLRSQLEGKERQAFDKLFSHRGGHLLAEDLAKDLGVTAADIYAWRRRWTRALSGVQ